MELLLENSESKTGLHRIRTIILSVDNSIHEFKDFINYKKVSPIYKKGEAKLVTLPKKGTFVYIRLVRNLRGEVFGYIKVIVNDVEVLNCKYRKLKIIRISGDKSYCDLVKKCVDVLKLPVKRFNIGK